MKNFHECWIFHGLFVTIVTGSLFVQNERPEFADKRQITSLFPWTFVPVKEFERKMKRYHCTIVQSIVS
jgi:hypothetical protein